MNSDHAKFWQRQAASSARWQNFAWCLDSFLPAAVAVSVAFACALLIGRKMSALPPHMGLWFGAALTAAALYAWVRARRKFLTTAEALVQIESQLHLHNRLTAAAAGIGEYPAPRQVNTGFNWRWRNIAPPLAASALIVAAAALVPLSTTSSRSVPTEQPIAWAQVESWIEQLEQNETVEPQSLEELREQLEQLRDRNAEEWYSHSSLEAGDNLRQQTAQSIQSLQRDLDAAAAALETLEQQGDRLSASELKSLDEALQKAIQGMELGTLPLNKELLSELKELDLSKLVKLTPEQLATMKKRLAECSSVCKECTNPGGPGEADLLVAALNKPGSGGITRGPGSAPLTFQQEQTETTAGTTEGVKNDDLSRALPGEVLNLSKGEHEVDRMAPTGPVAAGAVRSTGEGGEAVWRNDLTPGEREILRRFFK
jgi:hypothetical protein